ncbi:MAG: hypothetical protein ABI970_25615, partial [Chloroflexota bacterium]
METTVPMAKTATKPTNRFRWINRIPLYLVVIAFVVVTAFPIYWMIVSVIQPVKLSLQYPPPLFPQAINPNAFSEIFQVNNNPDRVDIWIGNSILLATMTTIISLLLSILGAYALAGKRWRGQNVFGFLLLMTQMLPEALILIPLYATIDKLQLKNNLPMLA